MSDIKQITVKEIHNSRLTIYLLTEKLGEWNFGLWFRGQFQIAGKN